MLEPLEQISTDDIVEPLRLASWMDTQGLESGPVHGIRTLAGGTQNIVLQFSRGDSDFVLRKPATHPRPNANRTMMREARLLSALKGTGVPHPALIASCEDASVLGSAFYLMEPVDGFNATDQLPLLHQGDGSIRHRMGLALVEGAVRLGEVDYIALGLDDFGNAAGFLQRQTARWRAQLESYQEHAGWPGPAGITGLTSIEHWLDANLPKSNYKPGIMHGDFHIGNILYRHDSAELAAILDWELATIGDPLLDLAWLLATWPDDQGRMPNPAIAVHPWQGFPTARELVAHYQSCSTRDLSAISWYAVLACYKLGIILEGSYARACGGKAEKSIGEQLHAATLRLFQRAADWIRTPSGF